MKQLTTFIILYFTLISCSQKKIKQEEIMNQDNVKKVTEIYKTIKKYENNPSYTLHIESAAGCSFEMLINDFPVYEFYDSGNCTGSIPINEALIKTGKQRLTLRMTPPIDKNFHMANEIDLENSVIKLSINVGDYGKQKVRDFIEILRYEYKSINQKLPYYEINLEFDAKVPYEKDIVGWQNSIDLSKENEDELLKEVEGFYKKMISTYEDKNINALAGVFYSQQKDFAQSYYNDNKKDFEDVIAQWTSYVNDTKPFVFNQYRMKFFGNKKIVALVKTDKFYLNESALMREDDEGNYQSYSLFLHRPKAGAPLEVIR